MTILPISDLHGTLPKVEREFDLMLICGDICPFMKGGTKFQKEWIFNEFVNWINNLPYKDEYSKVLMVFGNHDFYGEMMEESDLSDLTLKSGNRLIVLQNNSYLFSNNEGAVNVFGTPYCSIFGTWAYMIDDKTLDEKFSKIPYDLDILISHDSPTINKLGAILDWRRYNETTGNKVLTKHIERTKPKLFFSGHFHTGNHNFEKVGDTWMANVSILDEDYEFVNKLLCVDYDVKEKTVTNFEYISPDDKDEIEIALNIIPSIYLHVGNSEYKFDIDNIEEIIGCEDSTSIVIYNQIKYNVNEEKSVIEKACEKAKSIKKSSVEIINNGLFVN